MKKITGVFLSLLLVLQTFVFGISYADTEENAETDEFIMEMTVLNKLNIIKKEETESRDGSEAVSRAEFVVYTARAFMLENLKDKIYFKDIPVSHWANGEIGAMVENGIIDKAEDGLFNPDNPVTPEQAYKIILSAAGYKKYADYEGKPMSSYVTAAHKAGISIKPEKNNCISLKEAAQLIYKGMKIGIARLVSVGENTSYKVFEEDTMFKAHNIYESNGRVEAVLGQSLNERFNASDENEIYIDGKLYTADSDITPSEYFGHKIKFIYEENKDKERNIIYIEKMAEDIVEIRSDLIKSFSDADGIISYYANEKSNKSKSYRFSGSMKIIYNGEVFKGRLNVPIDDFISEKKAGKITVIENSGENVVIIKSYRTVVAESYDEKTERINGFYAAEEGVALNNFEKVRFRDLKGNAADKPVSFPAVLGVAEQISGRNAEIVVCGEKVNGIVESVYVGSREIKINGEKYKVDREPWNKFSHEIKTGANIELYLGIINNAAYVDIESESMNIGYIINAAYTKEGTDGRFAFKIFTGEKVETLYLADRVILDSAAYKMKDYRDFFLKFPLVEYIKDFPKTSVKVKPQIIRYSLNQNGQINEIDSMNKAQGEDDEKTLIRSYDGSDELIYNSITQRFGLNVLYSTSRTKLFVVPIVNDDGEISVNGELGRPADSMYSNTTTLTMDEFYRVEAYNYDYDNPYTDVIVIHKDPLFERKVCYMFDSLYTALDSDNCPVDMARCFARGGESNFEIDPSATEDFASFKQGDVIRLVTTIDGKAVTKAVKLFDAETMSFENAGKNPYWFDGTYDPLGKLNYRNPTWQLSKTYVYDIVETTINSSYEPAYLAQKNISERLNAKSLPVIVYDKYRERGDNIYVGSLSDIDTYKTSGYECSVILVVTNGAVFNNVFVYKQR